jgi:hypothetical protein
MLPLGCRTESGLPDIPRRPKGGGDSGACGRAESAQVIKPVRSLWRSPRKRAGIYAVAEDPRASMRTCRINLFRNRAIHLKVTYSTNRQRHLARDRHLGGREDVDVCELTCRRRSELEAAAAAASTPGRLRGFVSRRSNSTKESDSILTKATA